jgi:hypothetical protein
MKRTKRIIPTFGELSSLSSTGTEASRSSTPRITAWQAAFLFQVFMVLFYVMLAIWYYIVGAFPKSISEYMPGESPANLSTISLYIVFCLVWLAVLYMTWRGERIALLAGAVWGLFGVVGAILGFTTGLFRAPDFSDFLFFPISVIGIIMCAKAWRSLRLKTTLS